MLVFNGMTYDERIAERRVLARHAAQIDGHLSHFVS